MTSQGTIGKYVESITTSYRCDSTNKLIYWSLAFSIYSTAYAFTNSDLSTLISASQTSSQSFSTPNGLGKPKVNSDMNFSGKSLNKNTLNTLFKF